MATNVKCLPLLFASIADAEVLSEHNEQHAAIQAAANRLYDAGCVRVESPRTTRFGVWTAVNGEYPVTGNGFTVRCVKWQELVDIELNWTRPTLRMDGAALPVEQISGYMIHADGELTFVSGGNTLRYIDEGLSAGTHAYSIATVDTNAQIGPYSAPLSVVAH